MDIDFKEADLVSEIDSTLKIIRKNIVFEGQSVFVSIADDLCSASTIKLDFKMSILELLIAWWHGLTKNFKENLWFFTISICKTKLIYLFLRSKKLEKQIVKVKSFNFF